MALHDDVTQLLWRLARAVTARHDLEDVLAEAFRCLRPIVPFGGGSIQLLDDQGWIHMAAADPAAPPHVMSQRVPLGTSVAGRVILTEQPIYLTDLCIDELSAHVGRVSPGVRSYFAVPLLADGHAIGVLQVDSPEPDQWSDYERSVFVGVAPVVAAAIQNARAHARAAAARALAESAQRRVVEAREILATARSCLAADDREELERHLYRLEAALSAPRVDVPTRVLTPEPRVVAVR